MRCFEVFLAHFEKQHVLNFYHNVIVENVLNKSLSLSFSLSLSRSSFAWKKVLVQLGGANKYYFEVGMKWRRRRFLHSLCTYCCHLLIYVSFLTGQHRSLLFGLFKQTSLQFLQQIYVTKCPSNIWCRDSNPRSSENESSPITTSGPICKLVHPYCPHITLISI